MALSNSQYDAIMQGYERTQDNNRRLMADRTNEIYMKLPKMQEIDSEVASISVSKAKLLLDGDSDALHDLKENLHRLSKKRHLLLTQNGYPEDYLEPIYSCTDCRDTGYITNAEGFREKCHCFCKKELTLLYEQSHIQDMIAKENFSTLSCEYYKDADLERFKGAVRICKDFVQNFKQDYHNLLFYGTVGVGKSFLSGCIAKEILEKRFSVLYFSASGLFDTLARYAFDAKEKETLSGFYEDLYNCELLIIDDMGTEVTNTFVSSQLFACINERNLRSKSTIISTNLNLGELRDRYSDRVFSRITSSYTICKLTGPDIRMLKKRSTHTPNT